MNEGYRKMEIELVRKSDLPRKIIHDLTDIKEPDKTWEFHQCPFCHHEFRGQYGVAIRPSSTLCSPSKRFSWGWFPKRYCTLEGYHRHFFCPECYTDWITRLATPDSPIGYVP